MTTLAGSALKRVTDTTPGTFSRFGTCSVSYTSLNSASLSGSTSMLAMNTYLVLTGMRALRIRMRKPQARARTRAAPASLDELGPAAGRNGDGVAADVRRPLLRLAEQNLVEQQLAGAVAIHVRY